MCRNYEIIKNMCKFSADNLYGSQTPTALPYHPVKYSKEQQLQGIGLSDNKVFRYINKECWPSIRLMIHRMGGSEEDALLVFKHSKILF